MTKFDPFRFDLEQELLRAWNISEDFLTETKQLRKLSENPEEILDYIKLVKQVFDIKMERLWDMFEEGVRKGNIR